MSDNPTSNDDIVRSLHELFERLEKLEEHRDGLQLERFRDMTQRLAELEDANSAPEGREDIAAEIFSYYESELDEPWVEAIDLEEHNSGPLGGTSSRVLLKLKRSKGKRVGHKYVVVQVYDDDRIQKLGAQIAQSVEDEQREARGF